MLGIEYWHDKWFIGGNTYKLIGKTKQYAGETKIAEQFNRNLTITNVITTNKYYEKPLPGVDAKLGYAVTENLTGYVGGYYFSTSGTSTVAGPKIRFTYNYPPSIGKLFKVLDGLSIKIGAQHDKPRGSSGYIGVKFKLCLTDFEKNSNISRFERHIMDLIRRDQDVIIGRKNTQSLEILEIKRPKTEAAA